MKQFFTKSNIPYASRKISACCYLILMFAVIFCVTASNVSAENPSEKVTISFNNADILDVIRWASDLTNKNIIVNEAVKNKKVTVIAGEPMSKKEAYEAFLSVLQVSGLVVVETDGALKIFPAEAAKSNAIPLLDDEKADAEDAVIRIIKINNVPVQQLLAMLRPLVPGTAAFESNADTNILLIADTKANIDKITKLIEKIDKAGTIDIEVIQLKHASAKEVVELVSTLVPKIVGTGKDAAPTSTQAVHFAADERSNSILMSGDPVLRTQIRKLIERIDQPLDGEGNTKVFYLNYIDAKEMATILEKISGAVVSTDKDKKTTVSEEGKATIVASEANNALVITASPELLKTMKDVIDKLDVRREQVLVEALLVEVNEDVGRQIGYFWTPGTTGNIDVGGSFDPGKLITVTAATSTAPATASTLGGLFATAFRSGNLRGVLSALETVSDSNVLSTPTIMALDNEEAEILVGENVPFKTGEQNTTATTTPGNQFVQIQRQDIGVHLKVKPKINLNDTLTLEIDQKVESIVPDNKTGSADIITDKRELKTKAIVKDGEILVLGGLIRDESQESETKVPFLGDIPIIGWLFKGTTKTMVKRNLMVFIHPKILRSDHDDKEVSINNYERMSKLQDFYNKNTDFLTIRKNDRPRLGELPDSVLHSESAVIKEEKTPLILRHPDETITKSPVAEPSKVEPAIVEPTATEEVNKTPVANQTESVDPVNLPPPVVEAPITEAPLQ